MASLPYYNDDYDYNSTDYYIIDSIIGIFNNLFKKNNNIHLNIIYKKLDDDIESNYRSIKNNTEKTNDKKFYEKLLLFLQKDDS